MVNGVISDKVTDFIAFGGYIRYDKIKEHRNGRCKKSILGCVYCIKIINL